MPRRSIFATRKLTARQKSKAIQKRMRRVQEVWTRRAKPILSRTEQVRLDADRKERDSVAAYLQACSEIYGSSVVGLPALLVALRNGLDSSLHDFVGDNGQLYRNGYIKATLKGYAVKAATGMAIKRHQPGFAPDDARAIVAETREFVRDYEGQPKRSKRVGPPKGTDVSAATRDIEALAVKFFFDPTSYDLPNVAGQLVARQLDAKSVDWSLLPMALCVCTSDDLLNQVVDAMTAHASWLGRAGLIPQLVAAQHVGRRLQGKPVEYYDTLDEIFGSWLKGSWLQVLATDWLAAAAKTKKAAVITRVVDRVAAWHLPGSAALVAAVLRAQLALKPGLSILALATEANTQACRWNPDQPSHAPLALQLGPGMIDGLTMVLERRPYVDADDFTKALTYLGEKGYRGSDVALLKLARLKGVDAPHWNTLLRRSVWAGTTLAADVWVALQKAWSRTLVVQMAPRFTLIGVEASSPALDAGLVALARAMGPRAFEGWLDQACSASSALKSLHAQFLAPALA